MKSAKKLLVEHRLLKHADSRETMQITWLGLHLVSFLPPVPHTLNPLLYQPQDKQSYRCGLPLSRMLCWCQGITLPWVCPGALRGCTSSVVRTQKEEHHSPLSLSSTQQQHHLHHLGQTRYLCSMLLADWEYCLRGIRVTPVLARSLLLWKVSLSSLH